MLYRAVDDRLSKMDPKEEEKVMIDNVAANDICVNFLKGRLIDKARDVVKGEHLHMRCTAHVVNLIVDDGLKVINQSIKRVREAIRYVRHSPARLKRFRECCVDEGIEFKSLLCLDMATRWNSTYLMLSVALKFEKAFERFEDWIESPNSAIKDMTVKMLAMYNKYWGEPTKMNKLIYLAVVIDPRYKFAFINYYFREEFEDDEGLKMASECSESRADVVSPPPLKKVKYTRSDRYKRDFLDGDDDLKDDLEIYLSEKPLKNEK
ncbi:hypothetical protein C2S52_001402 [Perilla frutescens var. hirtella]|nr:hypothetical protein C2S52_001402 [Perilla frutescens var. hirtella]